MQQLLPKVCRSPLQAAQLQSLTGRTKTQSLETDAWDLLLHRLLLFLPAGSGLLPFHAEPKHGKPIELTVTHCQGIVLRDVGLELSPGSHSLPSLLRWPQRYSEV